MRAWNPRVNVAGHVVVELDVGWRVAMSEPGRWAAAADVAQADWRAVRVPVDAHALPAGEGASDPDAHDWWFQVSFAAPDAEERAETVIALEGIATVAEIYLNGALLGCSESMFRAVAFEVGSGLEPTNELTICCRALEPLLRHQRRPRARWRTGLVSNGNLRFVRTMLLGRAPGLASGPPIVGPWRPVRVELRSGVAVERLVLRPRVEEDGTAGTVHARARVRPLDGERLTRATIELHGDGGPHTAELELVEDGDGYDISGTATVPEPALWWPHTHGSASLYGVALELSGRSSATVLDAGRIGFRTIAGAGNLTADGLDLHVNGVPVFARGALWTPLEASVAGSFEEALRTSLRRLVEAGMNMIRIPGTTAYESTRFHDLCDEFGLLVWQDLMFANLDYPESDPDFMEAIAGEVRELLDRIGGRPSLAVLCGSSEVAQQVAMLGLDPALAVGPLFGDLLPRLIAEADVDAPYIPSAPWNAERPFRPDRGVANYFGVGGYRRPLADARLADVRFAAECLAIANVPDDEALADLAAQAGSRPVVHDPAWKAGVPRDAGTGWDFDDVRDHYLGELYGIDPVSLRSVDPERYLEISRAVSGEVMAEVFGEWRRARSPSRGGLILWWRDLRPGAGWGLLDHRGEPKAAYHHLRRVLAPVAVWSTNEGLSGMAAHVANDGPSPLDALLRITLYRDGETKVLESATQIHVPAHETLEADVETLFGHFVDVSWAYRFGPAGHDVVVLSLEDPNTPGPYGLHSQSFRFPERGPLHRESGDALGVDATLEQLDPDTLRLTIGARRLLYCVRAALPGFNGDDDCFSIEPGGRRAVTLRRSAPEAAPAAATLTALNLSGPLHVPIAPP